MYLLDTNIVSSLRKPKPHPRLLTWLFSVDAALLRIPVPTLTEIQMGIERTRRSGNHEKAGEIQAWLDGLSARTQVAPLTAEAATLWGKMLESPLRDDSFRRSASDDEQNGRKSKTNWVLDLMIASISITTGQSMVTDNARDFKRIHALFPLPGLFNPMRPDNDELR